MKINPQNGHFTLSEFGNRAPIPKMTTTDYIRLGFKLGNPDDPSAQGQIDQKTFPFLGVHFQEGLLKSITIGVTGNTFDELDKQAKHHLKQLGIKAQAYNWGTVEIGFFAQSGEMWIDIRYG
jgi:hypothetical protein